MQEMRAQIEMAENYVSDLEQERGKAAQDLF